MLKHQQAHYESFIFIVHTNLQQSMLI